MRVETAARTRFAKLAEPDTRARPPPPAPRPSPPLYPEAAELLADDVLRLLFHKDLIPRSVLVEYLKILFAFHLALYHLQIMKLLPALVRGERPGPDGGFFLDVGGVPGTAAARLAERSAAVWYDRIPEFVRATFMVKKLDRFAQTLLSLNQLGKSAGGGFTIDDLVALLGSPYREDRTQFAGARLNHILDSSRTPEQELDSSIAQLLDFDL